LALLDPDLDVEGNVVHGILDPGARLHDESQHILDAFLAQAQVHYSIIEAIASGNHTWSSITSHLGKSSVSLSRPMNWLIAMDVVERVVPITEKHPARSKHALYRLADPHMRFWHRLVAPLVQTGVLHCGDATEVYRKRIQPHIDDMMGAIFEDVCRAWVRSADSNLDALRVGEWWDKHAQVDVVAVTNDDALLVGECKWGAASRADLDRLRAAGQKLRGQLGTRGAVRHLVFSGQPPDARAESQAADIEWISLDRLFDGAAAG